MSGAQQFQANGSQDPELSRQQASFYGQDVDDEDDFGEDQDLIPDFPAAGSGEGGAEGYLDEAQTAALAEAQQAQQQQQAAAALAAVPEQVRKYIVLFSQAVSNNNTQDISSAYEGSWNRLTEKFYQRSEWPEAEVIAPLVNNDSKFLMLYRELWFRHVYSRLSPDGEDRFSSYDSYCDFFNYVLNSDGPVPLELPPQWLWDIVDEFIYQFQSYSQWRNRVANKSEDELQLLQDGGVWSSYSVLNVLYSLIQKSRITEQLIAAKEHQQQASARAEGNADAEEAEAGSSTDVAGEFGAKPLYKMLGYFSIIGLLRVHVLLGDYTLALKMLDHIELGNKKMSGAGGAGLVNRVTACHVTAYYYVGFAYMMLRRYPDAIKSFTHILIFTMRLRQYHTRSYQYDQINKTVDRMYALLAICCALCPTRLDENIQNTMRDKYGEHLSKMLRGNDDSIASFEELFLYACPKFITSNSPPYHDSEALDEYIKRPTMGDPAQHQLRIFLADVRAQLSNANIRSFLRLFTTLGTAKLSTFLDIDEEELTEVLMQLKSCTRSPIWTGEGSLLDSSEVVNTSDLDFFIDGKDSMIHISESRAGRRYAEWFKRNSVRMHDVLAGIQGKPLPITDATALAAAGTTGGPSTEGAKTASSGGAPGGKSNAWNAKSAAAISTQ